MAGEWETVPLDSLVEPGRGISYGIVQPGAPVADGVPIVRVSDVRDGRVAVSAPLRVAPAIEAAYARTRLTGGELLLTLVGTVGEAAVVPASLAGWNTARAVAVIPVRKDVGAYWIKLALAAPGVREIIDSRLNTTVQATLNLADVARLPIVLPPVHERETIAHILGTLDDKIELNRRMNETLEAMARALFKSWFVDFDPVRAKAEGRDPGLPKPIADLFPDRLVDSELGEIPEGWGVGRFGDLVEQLRDQESPLSFPDALYQHFSIPAFDDGQTARAELGESIKSLKSRVLPGVILMSKLNPEIDRVWMVDVRPENRAVCSTEFLVLRGRPPFTRGYTYCLTRSPLFRQQIKGLVTGTSKSHQRAQVESILNLFAIRPPARVVSSFDRSTDAILARTLECRREGRALAALRDALLPKLISGELQVKNAERIIEVTA
ncbi:MAG: restriction endonuclease subunit S [Burkholderiales bacterium]|nr:restriction endonuclease subunit S [Burkholderiales bacterium]